MIVALSAGDCAWADQVGAEWDARRASTPDRFSRGGGLSAPGEWEARRQAGTRSELAVARLTGGRWNGPGSDMRAPDVEPDLEVRYRNLDSGADLCLRAGDSLERRFVLVHPDAGEETVPSRFVIVGWAYGNEAWKRANYVDREGRRYVSPADLRHVDTLEELVGVGWVSI